MTTNNSVSSISCNPSILRDSFSKIHLSKLTHDASKILTQSFKKIPKIDQLSDNHKTSSLKSYKKIIADASCYGKNYIQPKLISDLIRIIHEKERHSLQGEPAFSDKTGHDYHIDDKSGVLTSVNNSLPELSEIISFLLNRINTEKCSIIVLKSLIICHHLITFSPLEKSTKQNRILQIMSQNSKNIKLNYYKDDRYDFKKMNPVSNQKRVQFDDFIRHYASYLEIRINAFKKDKIDVFTQNLGTSNLSPSSSSSPAELINRNLSLLRSIDIIIEKLFLTVKTSPREGNIVFKTTWSLEIPVINHPLINTIFVRLLYDIQTIFLKTTHQNADRDRPYPRLFSTTTKLVLDNQILGQTTRNKTEQNLEYTQQVLKIKQKLSEFYKKLTVKLLELDTCVEIMTKTLHTPVMRNEFDNCDLDVDLNSEENCFQRQSTTKKISSLLENMPGNFLQNLQNHDTNQDFSKMRAKLEKNLEISNKEIELLELEKKMKKLHQDAKQTEEEITNKKQQIDNYYGNVKNSHTCPDFSNLPKSPGPAGPGQELGSGMTSKSNSYILEENTYNYYNQTQYCELQSAANEPIRVDVPLVASAPLLQEIDEEE